MTDPSNRRSNTPPPLTTTPEPVLRSGSGLFQLSALAEIPPTSHPAWEMLIKHPERHEFRYAAAGMLIFNLNLQWKRDPSKLAVLIKQAHDFARKYQPLLADDLRKIFK